MLVNTLLTTVLLLLPLYSNADYTNRINPHKTWGVWEGWGTSLAWWANVFGDRDDLADLMFTTKQVKYNNETIPGLGLNIARYNLGGCSNNLIGTDKMALSKYIPKFKQMEGYWLDWTSDDPGSASWDWSRDYKQRQMVIKAIARGADQIELFSNSPMWWMLYDHNPSGAPAGGENLQSWNYDKFAIYLATVAKYAQDHWNISFVSIEAFNEATAPWWTQSGVQEGCHIGSETQQKVIQYLRQELDKRGLNETLISASDENTYNTAIKLWDSFPADVKAKVNRVNVHGYSYGSGSRDKLYDEVVGKDAKKLWNSEYGEGDSSGLQLAQNLNLDIFWLHPTAWVYWQTIDVPGWGLIEFNQGNLTVGKVFPKYYVMAHYSRHIRKGMQIITSDRSNSTAAYDERNHRLVIVTVNTADTSVTITYDLSQFTRISDGTVSRWSTTPAIANHLYVFDNNLTVQSKQLTVKLNAKIGGIQYCHKRVALGTLGRPS